MGKVGVVFSLNSRNLQTGVIKSMGGQNLARMNGKSFFPTSRSLRTNRRVSKDKARKVNNLGFDRIFCRFNERNPKGLRFFEVQRVGTIKVSATSGKLQRLRVVIS